MSELVENVVNDKPILEGMEKTRLDLVYTTFIPPTVSQKGKVLIIGDLHVSDRPSRRHKDYWGDCVDFLLEISNIIRNYGITHLVLLGDIVGRTTEKNLQHRDNLMALMKILQEWNQLTQGNVYLVEGNHDVGENLTDVQMLVTLGYFKRVKHFDVGNARFHISDYGNVHREIDFKEDGYNTVLAHADIKVEGETTWYPATSEEVELASLTNYKGVDLVVSGHIHNPSQKYVTTQIEGETVGLYYPGCGPRPIYDRNVWNQVFGLILTCDEGETQLDQYNFKLKEDIWAEVHTDDDGLDDEEQDLIAEIPTIDIERLGEILSEFNRYNMMGENDFKTQVKNLGGLDSEAVELALTIIEQVEQKFKTKR